jgi:DNA-binding response OmpR family regulator
MGDINRVYRSARHLKGLIDDVLDLSQADTEHMPLITERVSPTSVIRETVEMMGSLAEQKGLDLIVDVPEQLPPVFLDRLRIRQVLLNLLNNAIRLTDSGNIVISARMERDAIRITVADTGPGIAPEDIPKIFQEFQQLDPSLSRRKGGVGLGLALSRRFIRLHGGRMWVESEPGQGSHFHFTLPLVPPSPESIRVPVARPTIPLGVKDRVGHMLLVTTDEPMAVNLLKRHLQGYQIIGVRQEDLLEATETYLPHAIIAHTSFELFEEMDTISHVPIVSCPLPDPEHINRVLGVDDYLVKPIMRERLLDLLAGYGNAVRHVLIVDDDAQLAELLARFVQAAPSAYTVDIACGGREGVTRMREHCPDLVLLDLAMQDLDGLAVLELMRADKQLAQVPVVTITAQDLPEKVIYSLPQKSFSLRGGKDLTPIQMLHCLQAVLDAMPLPKPSPWPAPTHGADLPAQPAL